MNSTQTLYISDLDGTLLNPSAKLSTYTEKSLNRMIAKGLNFSVATARLLKPVQEMLANLKLNIPIILMNGVLIYDPLKDSYIRVNELPRESLSTVIKTIRTHRVTGFMYEFVDEKLVIYSEAFDQKFSHSYIKKRIARYSPIMGFPDKHSNFSIYFTLIDTFERLQPVHDSLAKHPNLQQSLYKNVYCPDLWHLEIFSLKASKGNAVSYLRELYGFNHIIGFGDELNDLPLFAACDVRVAVENANSVVKDAADYICGTNYDDGVAKWIGQNHSLPIQNNI